MTVFSYFNSISQAMLQIFLLGLVGFVLAYKSLISEEGVRGLTDFFINIAFPALIFWQIVTKFSFNLYPDWWIFPLIGLSITALGLLVGHAFSRRAGGAQLRREFICLVGFQNSGYLPLVLLNWIVPKEQLAQMLIYLFLFLLSFNLVIWSWGVYFLSAHKARKFSLTSLLSPPVIAMLSGFGFVALNIGRFLPGFILSPLEALGNCSFPLAMVVVGASLAGLYQARGSLRERGSYGGVMFKLILAKLVVLPLLGLLFIWYFKFSYLTGLLVILELAVPSATNLTIISRKYSQKDEITSQGVFLSHIAGLVTLPLFLTAFNHIVFLRKL